MIDGSTRTRCADRLHSAAWRATRALARPTSAWRAAPAFLIAGAQRAATTSLCGYLLGHPAIVSTPLMRGVHYFDDHYDKGFGWYLTHFPTRAQFARVSARVGAAAMTGESNPYYMFHPRVPERIASALADVKLIVVLRDPVVRAWSHLQHETAAGHERLPFEEALAAEMGRLAGEEARLAANDSYRSYAHQHHSYVARGKYLDQLRRLHTYFPREQVCVLESGDLARDPQGVCDRIADFLGLPRREASPAVHHGERTCALIPEAARRWLAEQFAEPNERLFDYLGVRWDWTRP